ncbi:AzlC family ABC transporter permease [Polymorphospora sp. NPDC050346]|uniref:AzlC family ABC transporter permease n=1 Tax=Polymorphospora sp. NPDC050346 TaxID=3155780 RepID=UPI0034024FC3
MRSGTGGAAMRRDVAAIAAAMIAVGASFGAIAVGAGIPVWAIVALSSIVYAGGAQFMAVGLIAAGSPFAAVFAGLLLNARHLPFGLAIGDVFGGRWSRRVLGSHLMTDEATAFSLAQPEGEARRRAFWLAGIVLFLAWNVGTIVGVLLGGAAGDPAALGLDAAFPAGLIALILPALRDRDTRRVALLGALVAVVTTPLLPAGLPVLLALTGLTVLFLPRRREPAPVPATDPAAESAAGPEPPAGSTSEPVAGHTPEPSAGHAPEPVAGPASGAVPRTGGRVAADAPVPGREESTC